MTLTKWLLDCGCTDIKPVTVHIGEEAWHGARYKKTHTYTAEMDCVRDGRHKVGNTYTERIYCIGKLPIKLLRSGKPKPDAKVCFPFEEKDWYVAGYIQDIKPQFEQFHPFGVNFILAPWDIPGEKIDHYEEKPYTRVSMDVV